MAASSFLALAYTFGEKGHIRITLFLEKSNKSIRRFLELWCLAAATFFSGFFSTTFWTQKISEIIDMNSKNFIFIYIDLSINNNLIFQPHTTIKRQMKMIWWMCCFCVDFIWGNLQRSCGLVRINRQIKIFYLSIS